MRAAVSAFALLFLYALAAYVFSAVESPPGAGSVAAAVALVAVAGSGLLYAWRLGTGGYGD